MPNMQLDYATLPLPLTSAEQTNLNVLEGRIARGLETFYEVGEALILIRQHKLYRITYRTFEDYCAQRWHIGRASAYRMIDAAEVKDACLHFGDTPLPTNEAQVRALKAAPKDQQAAIWQKARESAPNGKVTANHIHQVIQTEIPMPEPPPAAEPTWWTKPFEAKIRCEQCGKDFRADVKPNGVSYKRFVQKALPVRTSRREAQEDLDAFAQAYGLKQVAASESEADEDEDAA